MILRPPLPVKTREEMAQTAAREARGVTLAAAFDLTLAILLAAFPVAMSILYGFSSQQTAAAGLLALIGGPLLFLLVEGLRRAREMARILQIILSSVLVFPFAAGTLGDLKYLLQGEVNPSASLPLLVVTILVVWGLTRRQTVAWFTEVAPAEALAYFDRRWLTRVALIGVVGGMVAIIVSIT